MSYNRGEPSLIPSLNLSKIGLFPLSVSIDEFVDLTLGKTSGHILVSELSQLIVNRKIGQSGNYIVFDSAKANYKD